MKQLALLLVTGFVLSLYAPAFAVEQTATDQKNECLLASKGCMAQADSLQQKIKKLDAEIKKGTRVYTPDELKRLNDKLKEAEGMVDVLLQGGGGS